MFSSVTSWLGVGQRPKDEEDNKENEGQVHSESKDSISSTSVETSVSSKSGLTETESSDGEGKASSTSDDTNPLDTLEDVSAKALSTAKEFGNILFSFGKAAGKSMADTAKQIKSSVEEKTLLGDFHKEQDKFVEERKEKSKQEEASVPPWVGYNDEENLKKQILALSQDKRNFVRKPPSGVKFSFDFDTSYPIALATLQEDPNLQKMRFDLVPKAVNEEMFWSNYFYRVSLIRQSSQLTSSLAQSSGKSSSSSSRRSSTGSEAKEGIPTPSPRGGDDSTKKPAVTADDDDDDEGVLASSPPGHDEFVSDAFQGSHMSEEDIRKEMEQQLRVDDGDTDKQADNDEWKQKFEEKLLEQKGDDWEKELQQELQDYELIDGEGEELDGMAGDAEDDALEREILQQIEQEAEGLS